MPVASEMMSVPWIFTGQSTPPALRWSPRRNYIPSTLGTKQLGNSNRDPEKSTRRNSVYSILVSFFSLQPLECVPLSISWCEKRKEMKHDSCPIAKCSPKANPRQVALQSNNHVGGRIVWILHAGVENRSEQGEKKTIPRGVDLPCVVVVIVEAQPQHG